MIVPALNFKKATHGVIADLTEASLNICVKCKTNALVHRHHKGHEKILALMFPKEWKARYDEFREEDCVRLCADCHEEIHGLYGWIIYGAFDRELRYTWPSLEDMEQLRKELIKLCNWWLRYG